MAETAAPSRRNSVQYFGQRRQLAPNKVHMGRLLRLPLTVFECARVAARQSLSRDQFAYCDRPPKLLVRHRSRALCPDNFPRGPPKLRLFLIRHDASGSPIRRWRLGMGVQYGRHHASQRKGQHRCQSPQGQNSLNWTLLYRILAGSSSHSGDTPNGSFLGAKPPYLELPSDSPGADAHRRVSVVRGKPCQPLQQ